MKGWYHLLNRFETLHPEIQEQVYRSFYDYLYKDIYYLLKDHALTEDLIQEIFFKVTSTMHRFHVKNPIAWIKKVARNKTFDYLRRTNKERYIIEPNSVHLFDLHTDVIVDAFQVEQEVEKKIRDEILHQSISELKPDYRLLIKLHYIDEMSYKEIAATLEISEHAVGQKLLRARKKLLQIFQKKWVKFSV